jgi:hypothetical protein
MTITARLLVLAGGLWLAAGVAHADLDDIRRAAESGNAESQLELGILFQYGFNYPDNEIPALTWYTLSANQGNAKAARLRDVLMSKMSSKDVEEAMDQVKRYTPTGAPPAPAATEPAPPSEPAVPSAGAVVEPLPAPAEPPAAPATEPPPVIEPK